MSIHPEAVTTKWKQADLIYRMSDVYQSIDSGMLLVHVYEHQNRDNPASTIKSLSPLNVQLGALSEHIMASFLLSSATRKTIAVGFSDIYGLPSVSIHRVPVHYNISQSMVYKISKLWLIKYRSNRNLTHMADW